MSSTKERMARDESPERLFEDENTRMGDFLELYWGRLDEALYRIDVEPEDHGYREVAEYDLTQLKKIAADMGIDEEQFGIICEWVTDHEWKREDTGERWIETPEGREWYNGRPTIVLGRGSLPPGEASIAVLKAATAPTPLALADRD